MDIKRVSAEEVLGIRHEVLWPEKPVDFCRLEDDKSGIHYGCYIDNKLVSVASVFIHCKRARLRKFATIKKFQGKGIGSYLLKSIITDIKKAGIEIFWCDARVSASDFYKRFSMTQKGDIFLKSDIEYIVMEREL